MKNTNKKGFTLVELIIVITILAILATIAFISFQSYSADARDTKRKSNISDIVKSVELKSIQGVNLLSFVSGSGSRMTSGYIAGTGITNISGSKYEAGNVNLTILGLGNEFKDNTDSYKIGVTTLAGGVYQVAGKMESKSLAFVKGTFNPRTNTGNGAGYFKLGDTLSGGTIVTKISADLSMLNDNISVNSTTLAYSDVEGLIKSTGSTTNPVKDGGSDLPY